MTINIKQISIILLFFVFISCSNNNLKEQISNLKRENDSLINITKKLEYEFHGNSFLLYKSFDNEVLGVLAKYEGTLPNYILIKRKGEIIDTLISNGIKPYIYFKDIDYDVNDTISKYELIFNEQKTIFHGIKMN